MSDVLLTARQAAERLGIGVYTLSLWIKAGKLSSVRLGPRTLRIAESELAKFLKARTVKN